MSPNQLKAFEMLSPLVGHYLAFKLVKCLPVTIIDRLVARIRAEIAEAESRGRLSALDVSA